MSQHIDSLSRAACRALYAWSVSGMMKPLAVAEKLACKVAELEGACPECGARFPDPCEC